ncbi:DUF6036 family nucleotidyltransferase [Lacisediminimonas sp.]|uniref:KfrB domain-containing protein n=1 Tax=Lacisediminimonas sp. TaxID=3060582 RepID=UPI0027200035|nr:DUF6036 family nucleotidyltransferase [Lacisediminimonas sp.]MDO8300475.1 hypothetical protein [Lacisediminimonas sp.]
MKRSNLEHLLRAAGDIVKDTQFLVLGSQAILGKYPDAPDELLWSMEVDLVAKNKPELTEQLNSIGEDSEFHRLFGYYADPITEKTAILPRGWKSRLINVNSPQTNGVTGLCLDPHDLFVAKVAAYRPKDIDYVRVMIAHGMVGKDRALELAATVSNPEDDLKLTARIIERITGLFAGVDQTKTVQINEVSGRYTGKIISTTETVAQQEIEMGRVVFHQASKIDARPRLGKTYTIEYKDGRGYVSDKDVDRGPSR